MNPILGKHCRFCKNNVKYIDYKDANMLKRYLTSWSKIRPATNTGLCSKHQRELAKAIKRARYLALVPYVSR